LLTSSDKSGSTNILASNLSANNQININANNQLNIKSGEEVMNLLVVKIMLTVWNIFGLFAKEGW
jgi:hypothetical protein